MKFKINSPQGIHLLVLSLLINLLLVTGYARANDSIRWHRLDFPPFENDSGADKNQGIVDVIKSSIQHELDEYQHIDAGLVNYKRLMNVLEAQNICHGALLNIPEIAAVSYLSVSLGIMPSPAILTTAQIHTDKLNGKKMVSLKDVLSNQNILFGTTSRTYGKSIDEVIEQHKNQKHIVIRHAPKVEGLYKMVLSKRIDYVIGYPAEALSWNRSHPKQLLVAIPIKETNGQYTNGRMACSKNEWGRKIIKRINQILPVLRVKESYISKVYLPWLPLNMHKDYLKNYHLIVPKDNWTNVE